MPLPPDVLSDGDAPPTAAWRIVAPTGVPLVDRYLRDRAFAGDELLCWAAEARDLEPFCRWVAAGRAPAQVDAAVRCLGRAGVLAYLAAQLRPRRGRRLGVDAVYRRLAALGRLYAWAAAEGLVAANPLPPERRR